MGRQTVQGHGVGPGATTSSTRYLQPACTTNVIIAFLRTWQAQVLVGNFWLLIATKAPDLIPAFPFEEQRDMEDAPLQGSRQTGKTRRNKKPRAPLPNQQPYLRASPDLPRGWHTRLCEKVYGKHRTPLLFRPFLNRTSNRQPFLKLGHLCPSR